MSKNQMLLLGGMALAAALGLSMITGGLGFALGIAVATPRPKAPPPKATMTVAAFSVQHPEQATLTADCKFAAIKSDDHHAVRAAEHEPSYASEIVRIEKDGPAAARLYEILKDGQEHRLTLKLRKGKGTRYVLEEVTEN